MTIVANLTSPDVAQLAQTGAILAVPLGSTEQHGPHLPLSTDTDVAWALCRGLAASRNVVIAPAIAYGSSGEHAGFAGTLSIGRAALELVLVELCRSAGETFAQIVLVSAHGGNAEPVGRAVRTLQAEGRDVLAFFPQWDGEAHAGRVETSIELALHPGRVVMARAERGDTRPLREILPLLHDGGLRAVTANGVLGDPRGATADEGGALLDTLAAQLSNAVDQWLASRAAMSR
ncbi:MAG: mycofactocin precursor peptide peptidase [Pseudonocardiales bacterium]|nr:mycofactocin precursor peptide peptidase [Pseudonocardiales bacterium]